MIFYQFIQLVSRVFLGNLKRRLQLANLILILPSFLFFFKLDLPLELREVFLNLLQLELALAELHLQLLTVLLSGVGVDCLEG